VIGTPKQADAPDPRVEEAKKAYPDFDEAVAEANEYRFQSRESFQAAASAMQKSENIVDIQYYFAKHPDEWEQLDGQNAVDVALRIGEIRAGLRAQKKPAAAPRQPSNAPAPIEPTTQRARVTKSAEDMSVEEYAAKGESAAAKQYRKMKGS